MADYGSLSTHATNAKREALIADMSCNGWKIEGNGLSQSENSGETYTYMSVSFDGQGYGYSYIGGVGSEDSTLADLAHQKWQEYKDKWDQRIEDLIDGWDRIEDPKKYDPLIASLGAATKKVAAGDGGDNSTLGNPALTDIGFIENRLTVMSGNTIDQFYRIYGPDRLRLVLDGHCEVMACLGLALGGQKDLWTKARTDVPTIVEASVEAFKQTRQNNSTEWSAIISAVTAAVGMVGAFTVAVPGLAPVIGAITATGGFLGSAIALVPKKPTETKQYTGSSPDKVYEDLKAAFKALDDGIAEQEDGQAKMLEEMVKAIGLHDNRENFHIHPAKGLAPEFAGSDDIIDLKYDVLNTIGYSAMPNIARAFLESVDHAQEADTVGVWYRPYTTVPGGTIGDGGSYGPFYTWQNLLRAIFPLMNDTAAEVIRAGEHLAEAGGYVKDSDQWAKDALGKNYKDVEGAGLGWQPPYAPPPPPRTPGGHRIPE